MITVIDDYVHREREPIGGESSARTWFFFYRILSRNRKPYLYFRYLIIFRDIAREETARSLSFVAFSLPSPFFATPQFRSLGKTQGRASLSQRNKKQNAEAISREEYFLLPTHPFPGEGCVIYRASRSTA